VPFGTSLASSLDLSYGRLTSDTLVPATDPRVNALFFQTAATPQNSLGQSATEFGNLTLILKWLMLQRQWFLFSGGIAGTIPTAPDTRVDVTDFSAAS
jgi:hypothetical protein